MKVLAIRTYLSIILKIFESNFFVGQKDMVGPPKIVPPKMSIARTFLLVASPTVQWRQGQEVTNVAFRDVSADRSVGKPWKWGRNMWKKYRNTRPTNSSPLKKLAIPK